MISYFMVGTNKYPEAVKFYDRLMTEMGASKVYEGDRYTGWGCGIGTPMFIVTKPYNNEPATVGNGTMISFDVGSIDQVRKLHAQVLATGGSNEGDPGMRGEQLYVAYCRDLDGNKMNFIYYVPASPK